MDRPPALRLAEPGQLQRPRYAGTQGPAGRDRDGLGQIRPWRERFELAQKYRAEHGDLEIPLNYKTENGIWLGSWLYRQRQYRRTGDPRLGEVHRRELDELLKDEKPHKQSAALRQREPAGEELGAQL